MELIDFVLPIMVVGVGLAVYGARKFFDVF